MANIEDYNAKIEDILSIPDNEVTEPNMPVDVGLQEAENLYAWSSMDKIPLATVGITTETLNDLPIRTGACRQAQSNWFKDRNSQLEAQRQWAEAAPEAFELRDELVHTFRYAYRNDTVILARVAEIAEGNSNADMIQDLNDLSVLGKNNTALLEAINFDLEKLDSAANASDELAAILALANGDKSLQSETKMIRDKAYLYMKQLVDEIRAAGKYVFWKNEKRLKGYRSEFLRQKNNEAGSGTETPETET
jgi:hypothetical protein